MDLDAGKIFDMGFALIPKKKNTAITEEVRAFVIECYYKGQGSKDKKIKFPEITKLIKEKFEVELWLKEDQVKGIIKNEMAKSKADGCKGLDVAQLDLHAEHELQEIMNRRNVAEAKQILERNGDWLTSHPMVVNGHEICTLVQDYKKRSKKDVMDAEIYQIDLSDLKRIVKAFPGGNLPARSTKPGLTKVITKLVQQHCPDECLKLA